MAGEYVSFTELTIAAAMITSNGWLDVLLYTFTRRSLIFGRDLGDDKMRALDTFRMRPDQEFGTTTIIESTAQHDRSRSTQLRSSRKQKPGRTSPRHGSTEELVMPATLGDVKAETTVIVQTDTMELGPVTGGSTSDAELDKGTDSFDARSRRGFK